MIGETVSRAASGAAGAGTAAGAAEPPGDRVPKRITLEAANPEAGRAAAAEQLGVPAAQVTVRVIAQRKRGFLGLGGELVELEATWTPPPPAIPGRVDLVVDMGRVSLAVFRPEGHGKPVDQAALDALLDGLPIDARDETAVTAALRAADGRPRVFGTISPSVAPAADSPVAVRIAPGELVAWLIPWASGILEKAAVLDALEAAGVTTGVDQTALDAITGKRLTRPVIIARGQAPRDGVDARPDFVLEQLASEKAPSVQSDGKVDYRDIGGVPSVGPGDVLVRKVAMVPGEPGFTVRGKVLPAKHPKDFDLHKLQGQNTGLNEDRTVLVAKGGGLPTRVGERIAVLPMYVVKGDLDFKTGNLDFDGNIVISGGVKPGFTVKASGSIRIGGTIEAARVAAGGDVTVGGGIVGQNEAKVNAGGSIAARFVQQADVHAAGAVTIGSEIRESTVISETSVTVSGQGRIVGGQVRGKNFVAAKVAGSSSGAPTSVQAGWGEQLVAADPSAKPHSPYVAITDQVSAGVIVSVGGGTYRATHGRPGGVWRESDGKIQYSAN